MGVLRSQSDVCEELPGGRGDGTGIGQKLDGLLLESDSLHLPGSMVRRASRAGRTDEWSELLRSDGLNPWTRVKL